MPGRIYFSQKKEITIIIIKLAPKHCVGVYFSKMGFDIFLFTFPVQCCCFPSTVQVLPEARLKV